MSKIAVEADLVKTRLLEIAQQARALATGLQNAAPGKSSAANPPIQYLELSRDYLTNLADQCAELADHGYGKRPTSGSP